MNQRSIAKNVKITGENIVYLAVTNVTEWIALLEYAVCAVWMQTYLNYNIIVKNIAQQISLPRKVNYCMILIIHKRKIRSNLLMVSCGVCS